MNLARYHIRMLEWLTGDDHGESSEAIAAAMTGLPLKGAWTPSDPDDLGRCLRLLALFPEWTAERFTETMSKVSPAWAVFAEEWPRLSACMTDEVGIDWSKRRRAPKTYALVEEVDRRAVEATRAAFVDRNRL